MRAPKTTAFFMRLLSELGGRIRRVFTLDWLAPKPPTPVHRDDGTTVVFYATRFTAGTLEQQLNRAAEAHGLKCLTNVGRGAIFQDVTAIVDGNPAAVAAFVEETGTLVSIPAPR